MLGQLDEEYVERMDVEELKERLKSVPSPFVASNFMGSAHDVGESSGAKKGLKVPKKLAILSRTKPSKEKTNGKDSNLGPKLKGGFPDWLKTKT